MKKLAMIGAGGHGKVVREAALISGWDEVDFYDDYQVDHESNSIKGGIDRYVDQMNSYQGVTISVGNTTARLSIHHKLEKLGVNFVTVIHPFTSISPSAVIGPGSVVLAGAIVNSSARIGVSSILNTGCSIDHDCVLGDFVHICPGVHLAGGVSIGRETWVGIGSAVIQNIKIGASVFVAAGSIIASDVPFGQKVRGVPAKSFHSISNSGE